MFSLQNSGIPSNIHPEALNELHFFVQALQAYSVATDAAFLSWGDQQPPLIPCLKDCIAAVNRLCKVHVLHSPHVERGRIADVVTPLLGDLSPIAPGELRRRGAAVCPYPGEAVVRPQLEEWMAAVFPRPGTPPAPPPADGGPPDGAPDGDGAPDEDDDPGYPTVEAVMQVSDRPSSPDCVVFPSHSSFLK